jgi:hypothetical protein
MKTVVLAKNHCANWLIDGACNGVDFKRPALKQIRFLPEGTRCLLALGKRCSYFETAVMPMKDWEWKDAEEGRKFKEGVNRYIRMHLRKETMPDLPPRERKCPDCGNRIGFRMRYCADCARIRKAENNRRNSLNQRLKK